jgi:hypothetical protein
MGKIAVSGEHAECDLHILTGTGDLRQKSAKCGVSTNG